MIRVNLLPGGKKRQKRSKGVSFSLPSFGGFGGGEAFKDRWTLAAIVLVPLLLGGAGYLYTDVETQLEEMDVAIAQEVADSLRYFETKQQTDLLLARSDSINSRVQIIQEIDEGRYVWSHIFDEVARALPDYTWVTVITQTGGGTTPSLRIQGQAGNNNAVAVFMRQLEASPFLRAVDLDEMAQTEPGAGGQVVSDFTLTASYETPPLDQLESVPLFESGAPAADPVPPDTLQGQE